MKNKERQRKFREDRKAEGLVRKDIWIKPNWWQKVKDLITELDKNTG
jgi:hypothetical protein